MTIFLSSTLCFDSLYSESKENSVSRTKFLCNKEIVVMSNAFFN